MGSFGAVHELWLGHMGSVVACRLSSSGARPQSARSQLLRHVGPAVVPALVVAALGACEILVPQIGIKPASLHWKVES